MAKVQLKYVGKGAYIMGVPAQDIKVSEKRAEELVRTGLYKRVKPEPEKDMKGGNK